jgi:hypothetical protein
MQETVITSKGLRDSSLRARKPVARLVDFPDGVTRHITLPSWKWAVLDRFDREDVLLSSKKIIGFAFEAAQADKRYPDEPFEETLRYHLSVYLESSAPFSSDYIRCHSNDFYSEALPVPGA